MRNPLTTLKAAICELLQYGRQSVALAEAHAARLDGLEARLESHFRDRLAALEAREAEERACLVRRLDGIAEALGAGRIQFAATIDDRIADVGSRIDALQQILVPPPEPPPPEPRYFGLDELDRTLEGFLDYDGGYFVELGANDGVAQSNTLHFEKFRGWRGLLVEPVPHNFLRCLANRAESTRVYCAACTAFDYPDRFVEIAFSNLMSTPLSLDSDIADPAAHAAIGRQFLAPHERVFSFGALARPLNTLLLDAGAPARIDLLSLDVEGAERDVLRGIDHSAFRFRYICVESRDVGRISAYLSEHGYEMVRTLTHHDHLFRDRGWSSGEG